MRPANRLYARLGKSEVLHLARLNQFLHRAGNVFYGHVGVNPMLIQQVDALHPEPFERSFHGLLDVLGLAIHACRSRPIIAAAQIEPKLGGDHHFAAVGRQRFAYKFFVDEWAVNFGGVKEGDAAFDGGVEESGSSPVCLSAGRRKSSFPCSPAPWPKLPDCFFPVCAFALFLQECAACPADEATTLRLALR